MVSLLVIDRDNSDAPPGICNGCAWCAGDRVATAAAVLQADSAGEKKNKNKQKGFQVKF